MVVELPRPFERDPARLAAVAPVGRAVLERTEQDVGRVLDVADLERLECRNDREARHAAALAATASTGSAATSAAAASASHGVTRPRRMPTMSRASTGIHGSTWPESRDARDAAFRHRA